MPHDQNSVFAHWCPTMWVIFVPAYKSLISHHIRPTIYITSGILIQSYQIISLCEFLCDYQYMLIYFPFPHPSKRQLPPLAVVVVVAAAGRKSNSAGYSQIHPPLLPTMRRSMPLNNKILLSRLIH